MKERDEEGVGQQNFFFFFLPDNIQIVNINFPIIKRRRRRR
jgi:hypothetical protein